MEKLLPVLALLACPVMMLICMRMMRGDHHKQDDAQAETAPAPPAQAGADTAERVAALERELAELRASNNGHRERAIPEASGHNRGEQPAPRQPS